MNNKTAFLSRTPLFRGKNPTYNFKDNKSKSQRLSETHSPVTRRSAHAIREQVHQNTCCTTITPPIPLHTHTQLPTRKRGMNGEQCVRTRRGQLPGAKLHLLLRHSAWGGRGAAGRGRGLCQGRRARAYAPRADGSSAGNGEFKYINARPLALSVVGDCSSVGRVTFFLFSKINYVRLYIFSL